MPANLFTRPLLPAAILCVIALCASAHAQPQPRMLQVSAGTGFVINPEGNLVTNNHVVRQCRQITVKTPEGEKSATLVATDAEHDLAVLQLSEMGGTRTAPLRWNIDGLTIGEPVTVIGFPGQAGVEGHSSTKKTTVTSLQGPEGQQMLIQLASVAEHGNSGGPVLDRAGNVIAVISGVSQTFWVEKNSNAKPKLVRQADVAITLHALQDFLHANRIPFYESQSSGAYGEQAIERNALQFILPIRCIQGEATSDLYDRGAYLPPPAPGFVSNPK